MERKIGILQIQKQYSGIFWDFGILLKKTQSRGFGIFRDFDFGIFWGKKFPNSRDLGFFGILTSGFFGGKIPKFSGFGIWELGSQKNPIPKPPLLWHLKSLGKKSKNFWKKLRIHKLYSWRQGRTFA